VGRRPRHCIHGRPIHVKLTFATGRHLAKATTDPLQSAGTAMALNAGHGVAVLLKIYAHCTDGQADAAAHRITDALGTAEPEPGPGDEGDADSEPAA
jgi:hypothetical protein